MLLQLCLLWEQIYCPVLDMLSSRVLTAEDPSSTVTSTALTSSEPVFACGRVLLWGSSESSRQPNWPLLTFDAEQQSGPPMPLIHYRPHANPSRKGQDALSQWRWCCVDAPAIDFPAQLDTAAHFRSWISGVLFSAQMCLQVRT